MNRIIIEFNTPEEVADFINICSKYISDINIYDGHIAVDAKSIISMFKIAEGKHIEVEMISYDENEIERFKNDIKKYEVK